LATLIFLGNISKISTEKKNFHRKDKMEKKKSRNGKEETTLEERKKGKRNLK